MKRLLALLLLLLGLCYTAYGQTERVNLEGTVTDYATGEALIGAKVISDADATFTDRDGRYRLRVPIGERKVTCSMLGYLDADEQIFCTADSVVNFRLEEDYVAINSVFVLADRIDKPTGSSFGKIEVNMHQLQMQPLFLGERDIFKYFQLLPGISGGKEGSSNLNIRGGSADQTQILLDGIPIYNQNHALGFVSIFNGDALSGAELYKGGIPAMYGGRLSGVAAITTRDGSEERHEQTLGIGTLTASFTAEGPISNRGAYLLSARYFTPNALLAAYYGMTKADTRPNYLFFDFTGKVRFRIGKHNTLIAAAYTGYDAMSYRVSETESVGTGDADETERDYEYELRDATAWGSLTGSLKLLTELKSRWHMENAIYYSGMANRYKSNNHDNRGVSFYSSISSGVGDIGVRSLFTFSVPQHEIHFGISLNMQRYTPKEVYSKSVNESGFAMENSSNNGERVLYNGALFADGDSHSGRWSFHYGVRLPLYYNRQEAVFTIEPRLGISFEINERNDLYLSYDRSTQPLFPLTKQFMGVPMELWMPYQSRELQSAYQISVGWKYRPISAIFISAEAYWKKMDKLYFVSDEDAMLAGQGGYELGTGNALGAEIVVQYTGRTHTILLSYTQSSSKRYVGGRKFDFEYDIPYNLNLYFQQRTLKRGDKTHYLSVNINYHAGIPYIASKEIYPVAFARNNRAEYVPHNPTYPNVRLPDYFRMDLNYSTERKLHNGKRVWQFSILNVTNHFNPQMIYVKNEKYYGLALIPIMPSFSFKRYFQ